MTKECPSFQQESHFYAKGILSDLQGAWSCLRSSVVEISPSEMRDCLIFHIDCVLRSIRTPISVCKRTLVSLLSER